METINSFGDYISCIFRINQQKNHFKAFAYRGQANAEWRITSGAYRRIEEGLKQAMHPHPVVKSDLVKEYLFEKLGEVRKRIAMESKMRNMDDLDLLVEMQHFGGATNLIDFTYNSLVALYFAVSDNYLQDGKVVCVEYSEPYKTETINEVNQYSLGKLFPSPDGKLYKYNPVYNNHRIVKQDSVFIFNDLGIIREDLIDHTIIIPAKIKPKVHIELQQVMGLSDEQIYPDFMGYMQANSYRKAYKTKSANDYYMMAIAFQDTKKFEVAIQYFDKALNIDDKHFKSLLNKTRCFRYMREYKFGLDWALKAQVVDLNNFAIQNELGILYTYNDKLIEARRAFDLAKQFCKPGTQSSMLTNNIGWMNLRDGRLDEAERLFNSILHESNTYHQNLNLGHIYLIRKDEKKAVAFYVDCISQATSHAQFRDSFDSDYCGVNMERQGITHEYYNSLLLVLISQHFTAQQMDLES